MVVAPKLFINSVMEKVPPLPSYTTQTTLLMEGSYLRVGRHLEPISRTLKVSCLLYPIMASKIVENFQSLIRKRQVLDTFISDQHLEMSTKQVGMKGNPPSMDQNCVWKIHLILQLLETRSLRQETRAATLISLI